MTTAYRRETTMYSAFLAAKPGSTQLTRKVLRAAKKLGPVSARLPGWQVVRS